MDLVEHDERRAREMVGEEVRRLGDLLVGHDDAVEVAAPGAVRVAPARVEVQPDGVRRVGPLRSQRGRRADDDDLLGAGGADRVARGERLARTRGRDEQEVRLRVRGVPREKLGLPRPWRDHAVRAPFSRLQRGHSAWPFAGSVAPPALTGSTWSPCQPGASGSPHALQRPCAAKKRATRALGRNRRAFTASIFASGSLGEDRARSPISTQQYSRRDGSYAQAPTPAGPRRAVGGVPPPRVDGLLDAAGRLGRALGAGARRGPAPDHEVEGPSAQSVKPGGSEARVDRRQGGAGR